MNTAKQLVDDLANTQKQTNIPPANNIRQLNITPVKKTACENCFLSSACFSGSLQTQNKQVLQDITHHPKPSHKGEYLYRQGDALGSIYIVRSGAVKLYNVDSTGDQHIAGFCLPGELFGMDGMLEETYRYSAVALDTTSVCEIPFKKLVDSIADCPDMHRLLVTSLCREIHDKQQTLLRLHHKHVEVRLATFLMRLSAHFANIGQSAVEFTLPMSRRDIALHLGMTEETISRLFTRLQKDEVLAVQRRNITINKPNSLKALALEN